MKVAVADLVLDRVVVLDGKPSRRAIALDGMPFLESLVEAMPDGVEKPPTEFRLFKQGLNETSKGTFLFDEKAAALVMAYYADQGNELHLDYEHQMLADPPIQAPAAGWFKPQVRDGELWATDVRWTPRALAYLQGKEYRYFSPAFDVDEDLRITKLLNCALTNYPATKRMQPLVAARRERVAATATSRSQTMKMDAAKKSSLKSFLTAALAALDADGDDDGDMCMKHLSQAVTALGGEPVAKTTGLRSFRDGVIALTGKGDESEALGVLHAMKKDSVEVVALRGELATIKASAQKAEFEALVEQGRKDGKLSPAMIKDWIPEVLAATEPVKMLRGFLSHAPKLVATKGADGKGEEEVREPPTDTLVELTDEEREVAIALGNDIGKAQKAKAERVKAAKK